VTRGEFARRVVVGLACVGGCSHTPGTLRFHNEDPHWVVDDRSPIAEPIERGAWNKLYFFEYDVSRPIDWTLAVPERRPARNVNALGEVPDSSWFTNRIGVRDLTVDEMLRGPNRTDGPVAPMRVTKAQADGGGFFIEDKGGATWILKFDPEHDPELGSAADVVAQRLLWAVGYHVPEDSVVYFARDELVLDPGATVPVKGGKVPFGEAELDAMLAARVPEHGRYRALASKFLVGEPKGPYTTEGLRKDDPNDRVPHEYRRDLRGQYVFFGWLAHTDLHAGNRLDMWIEHGDGRGHLEHNLIDFDRALGAMAVVIDSPWDAYRHRVDYKYMLASTLTLGLWKRPWEGLERPGLRGIGRFDSRHFEPDGYAPRDYFMPFLYKDRLDCFWAAKILMRLRPEHIRAAVAAAKLSDPRSAEYLSRVLIERQREIGRHWLAKVDPLDRFEVRGPAGDEMLCATDLLVHHRLDRGFAGATYVAVAFAGDGRRLPWRRTVRADANGAFCVDALPRGSGGDGYVIVSVATRRGKKQLPPVFVHMARKRGTGALRVIGLDRRL